MRKAIIYGAGASERWLQVSLMNTVTDVLVGPMIACDKQASPFWLPPVPIHYTHTLCDAVI